MKSHRTLDGLLRFLKVISAGLFLLAAFVQVWEGLERHPQVVQSIRRSVSWPAILWWFVPMLGVMPFLPSLREHLKRIGRSLVNSLSLPWYALVGQSVRRRVVFFTIIAAALIVYTVKTLGYSPAVHISVVPLSDEKGAPNSPANAEIGGTVSGVWPWKLRKLQGVLYAYTNTWSIQPYEAESITIIGLGGRWKNKTHPGKRYAILLVKRGYKPPLETGRLPPVGGPVVAKDQVEGTLAATANDE